MFRKFALLFKLGLLVAMISAGYAVWYCMQPLPLRQAIVDFEIAPGDNMRVISRKLVDAGVEVWPPVVTWLARVSGRAINVKAGSYRITSAITPWDLVQMLSAGGNAYAEVTFVEGWTFARMRATLNANPDFRHDSLGLADAEVMNKLDMAGQAPEGRFFPDTYSFPRGSSDLDVLARAGQRMTALLDTEWSQRASNLPLKSLYEALVLASVVEKETGKAEDRPLIASVFINRLKVGMPLQSDPTVIYGLGNDFDGNLRKRDLTADSPYNTYRRGGLPPTPIAMPGLAALRAVLHPPKSDYLYFVARGDGSSQFSRSLDEHNRAVARYQKAGRR